jgi:hypothetical protein
MSSSHIESMATLIAAAAKTVPRVRNNDSKIVRRKHVRRFHITLMHISYRLPLS